MLLRIVKVLGAGVLLTLFALGSAAVEDSYFDSAGVRLHYIVEGKGEPVVLIHGYGGNIDMGWTETGIVKGLADRYQVIAIDMRGHGRSDKPRTPAAYGLPMVDDVVRLMDRLKIQTAHVVGYSMGGRIAIMLLAERPERLRTAVIGGAGWMDAQALQRRQIRQEQTAQSLEQGKGVGPLILSLAPPSAEPPTPQQIEAFNRMFLSQNDPLALAAVARGISNLQPSESKLRGNKTPALALVGELDPNKTEVHRLEEMAPNLKVVVIPGANHLNAVRHPEFLNNLKAFLAAHSDR
jgi:pimeloyl-ACP methyl ester carboxylesterase